MDQPSSFLHPFGAPSATEFITMVKGRGAAVWDSEGNRYIDALASLWFCHVGHGRVEIADAVSEQLRTLDSFHTFEMFTNEPAELFAEMVAALAPMPLPRVFLTNSGSEAVDTALKLSRLYWAWQGESDRSMILSRERGYHGTNYGGTSAQGIPLNKDGFGPLVPGVVQADADDLDHMESIVEEHDGRIAAVIVEPLQGAGGVFPPVAGYLEGLRRICDDSGALLIFDEVVSGFGRLGTSWAAQRYGVVPDLITFAKGATSGYLPLGGVIVNRRVLDVLEADDSRWLRHGYTYSGHPAACAAGIANLTIIEAENLAARAPMIGERLQPRLQALVDEGLASALRGQDAIWGLAMNDDVSALDVRDEMLTQGVIPRPIATHTIAICPPLVITDDDLDKIATATRNALIAVGTRA